MIATSNVVLDCANELAPDQIGACFEEHGVVILERYFSAHEVAAMDSLLDAFVAELPNRVCTTKEEYARRFETRAITFQVREEPAFLNLAANPKWDTATKAVIGPGYGIGYAASWATTNGQGQGWHQDSFSDEPGQFVLNRVLFTRDFAPEQGMVYVVPGSHRLGDIPEGGNHEPLPGEFGYAPKAGTLVLLHSRCYHRVAINQTDSPRIQVNSRCLPAAARESTTYRAVFRTGRWDFSTGTTW